MTTAYQHRPMSRFLTPQADAGSKAPTSKSEAAATGSELPEKYRGKSVEDIIEMHRNAERRVGELGNELGTMRGIVTDLSRITRPQPAATTEEKEQLAVSGDELLADPTAAIRKVVQRDLDRERLAREEGELKAAAQNAAQALTQDYGDIGAIVQSPEFQEFASRTSFRQRDLQIAATGSGMDQVVAARRLLEDFTDYQKAVGSQEKPPDNVQEARRVSTEGSGNSGKVSSKPTFHESDVLKVIQDDPVKWRSPSFQKEITAAIRDGRYIKSA